ncbi:YgaP family membrane protein [Novosphingobium cyanobacteriorum]|uniref:DUF2892 domain-containing protein n=1 Tax=Novosphingobium cyanobacteriorum TaxID=3024215 RepID=A0ABT6CDY6_9SPHN|nr:DUF2892 domain-containing protein [Novosphingobium cyanobacteriorum]MDF8332144.1 DUF2892 domain-containing protein [Novosphingobium cyanobacteriorum]
MFKRNIGGGDAVVRVLAAAILFALALLYHQTWGLIGVVPLVTGVVGLCPLYSVLGIRTTMAPKAAAHA